MLTVLSMAKPKRKPASEDLRHEILDAARELFVTEGYENVSMRKIADKIGYSATTIYLYFNDKSELLREICETTFSRMADEIIASFEGARNADERLRRGLLTYIKFGLKNPHHYDVVFTSPKVRFMGQSDYTFEGSMGERAFETLVSTVRECIDEGVINRTDVALTAQTLWAGIHGITSLLIAHPSFPFVEREALIESVVDTMISGLKN